MLPEIRHNILLLTDCYNLSHQRLKCNTDWEVSHIYNRTAPMLLYGLNETVLEVLTQHITMDMVTEAEHYARMMGLHFPSALFTDVVEKLDGRIPLKFEALPDGSWVPQGTPFAQVSNTVKGYGELVTWWEALFLHRYFSSGCLTEAFYARQYLQEMQAKYHYPDSFLARFHSFGFRGHHSLEDAYWAGTAWNMFLFGTDDFHTIYHTPTAVVASISALAHKVTQQFDVEEDCYYHAIDATAASGEKVVAIVIDTYNADRFIDRFAVSLAKYASKRGIHVVFRPDSGDVLNQAIGLYTKCVQVHDCDNASVIIGMDMSVEKARHYDSQLLLAHIPLDFVSYGIGAGYYKHIERDTLGWSMKTAFSNGGARMKFSSEPIKQSLPGRVKLIRPSWGGLMVCCGADEVPETPSLYHTIYQWDPRGAVIWRLSWEEIQERAVQALHQNNAKQIVLSEEIQHAIEEFRKRYLNGKDSRGA